MAGVIAGLILIVVGMVLAAQQRRAYRESGQARDVAWLIGRHIHHDTSARRRRSNSEALGRRP